MYIVLRNPFDLRGFGRSFSAPRVQAESSGALISSSTREGEMQDLEELTKALEASQEAHLAKYPDAQPFYYARIQLAIAERLDGILTEMKGWAFDPKEWLKAHDAVPYTRHQEDDKAKGRMG